MRKTESVFLCLRRVAMGIFRSLREKSAVIRFLVNAQKTPWYPALFALLCVISGINDHTVYVPVLWILTLFHLFSVLFADDNKVFFTPLFMIYFALGCDTNTDAFTTSNGEMLAFMDKGAFKHIVAICIICVGSLISRLIVDGSVIATFKRRRFFTWSIIAMDVAFLANGVFSPVYQTDNFGVGALIAAGFTAVYFLAVGITEKSEDPTTYACYAMLGAAYVALLQIIHVVIEQYRSGNLILSYSFTDVDKINKDALTLGWGISTVVAAAFALGIPAAMYLAKNRKGCFFTYFSAPIFILGTVIINCRAAMIIGIAAFIVCAAVSCFTGKNRVQIRIYSSILVALMLGAIVYVHFTIKPISSLIHEIFALLRLESDTGIIDVRRRLLWENGIKDFKLSPLFGVGFKDGGYSVKLQSENFYSNMYHCILIQIPAAMGIVGCLAFILHIFHLAKLSLKKFSADRLILLMVPFMIIGMSLVDNFFFYANFQIFYGVFLALAEKSLPKS